MPPSFQELIGEFPEAFERILELESVDPDFVRLAKEYDSINAALQLFETSIDPVSNGHHKDLRRRKIYLKQKICTRISD
ncbi:hypothetical protein [Hyphomonas pacifica]|uniref:GTP-binding protein n=1 Tax=Hyphomonas pacifica TaxID=1280941 RepID=A0A062TZW6_9PROT|nr:hypothetical protein [Hyphomonas pacifica]KCZ47268.1 hypothetical protein HY2_16620 [Hyphomonas pacifica]RAN31068.1 hypothetical protein HY3_16995 [Hyphomonas pacifica]RAN36503.1 hypothetical protein HY11_01915 [Hyphomonas pacifica]